MKVLFDTNVILDVLLERSPHARPALQLMQMVEQAKIEGLLCATTVTTLYYLGAKTVGKAKARRYLETLLAIFGVAPVDEPVLRQALGLKFPDFEDAVLHEAARNASAAAIVTRNSKDFPRAALPIITPSELLAERLAAQ